MQMDEQVNPGDSAFVDDHQLDGVSGGGDYKIVPNPASGVPHG
jgi:hypothetical protein